MTMRLTNKLSQMPIRHFIAASGVALVLVGCSRQPETRNAADSPASKASQDMLAGTWLGNAKLGDRHILSTTVVDAQGHYVQHLTNVLSEGVRTATISGTLEIHDGLLVDTITNESGNTRVPRIASVMRILRLDKALLILSETNSGETVTYRKADQ